jgi:hypothetical protein
MYADDVRQEQIFDKTKQTAFANFVMPTAPTKDRKEEDYLINEFMKEINAEREGSKYKPMSFMAVKMKLFAIKDDTHALKRFLGECREAKQTGWSFGGCFFWSLGNKHNKS